MYKLLISDLDHTLLRTDGSISDRTLKTLSECRAQGIKFAIATARYWIGAEKYINILQPDYEITADGTVVHANGECVRSFSFDQEETNGILRKLIQAVPGAEITVAEGKNVYWNSKHIAESERLHKAIYCEYDKPLTFRANKIVSALPDESIAHEIADAYHCRLQCYRGEKWYAFLPEFSGKVMAIKAVSEHSGIALTDMVAFGDDTGDMDMLKMCGTGVAVANSIEEVRSVADQVTLSNDDDGVAVWIEKNIMDDRKTL